MGTPPPRYAVLLATAALSGGLLLTGCDGAPQPSPPPTGEGTVAASDPTTTPPTGSTGTTATNPSPTTSKPSPSTTKKGDSSPDEAGAPGVPKPARQHTKAGAKAFARYYLTVINQTGVKPEPGRLEPLATRACKSCNNFAARVATLASKNQRYSRPIFKLGASQAIPSARMDTERVRTDISQQATDVIDAKGSAVKHIDAQEASIRSDVRWTSDGWRVHKIYVILNASS